MDFNGYQHYTLPPSWFQEYAVYERKNIKKTIQNHGPSSAVYGLGFIGAAIWFISQSTTFWIGVLGFLKAIVWPAFLVYQALPGLPIFGEVKKER
jgi:hypothetical protein